MKSSIWRDQYALMMHARRRAYIMRAGPPQSARGARVWDSFAAKSLLFSLDS